MIGERYWSCGITLDYEGGDMWSASLDFYDDGWAEDSATQGVLKVRYFFTLQKMSQELDALIADAKKLGIDFKVMKPMSPSLYVTGDGEHTERIYHPDWQRILAEQSARIGWVSAYAEYAVNIPAENASSPELAP